ncbi:hypothetical protein PQX77_002600 [Marasmius sp. AFHP31]|nr:hypothetical protein PQX77_002600 [Marasmius sp. AFHP31]
MQFTTIVTVFASFLVAVPFVHGEPFDHSALLTARQGEIGGNNGDMPSIPPACSDTCLSNAPLDCTTSIDCSCTDKYATGLGACLDCVVKQDSTQLEKSQKFVNSFTDACNGLGKTVKPVKITGNSNVGSSSSSGTGSSGDSGPPGGGSSSGSSGSGNGGGNGADSNAAMATRVFVVGLGIASVLLLC